MYSFSCTWLSSHLAYIDGGTGSLLFQALIAGFLSVSVYVASCWSKIKASAVLFVQKKSHRQ